MCLRCDSGQYQTEYGATACRDCPGGHFCSVDAAVACSPNTYNPNTSSYLVTDCVPCPSFTTTGTSTGVAEVAGCVCTSGYYRPADGGKCRPCPIGTDCNAVTGTTAQTLPVRRGYYRLTERSSDVRRCPDAGAGCAATECADSTSACLGGDNAEELCRPGLTGPFCMLCHNDTATSRMFYQAADKLNAARCRSCDDLTSTGLS